MTQFEQALKKVQSANWHDRSEALRYLRNVDVLLECKEIIRLIVLSNSVELLLLLINLFTFWSGKFNLEILSLCLARAFELQDHGNRKVKNKAATYTQSFLEAPDIPTSLKYECMRLAYSKIHSKHLTSFLKSVARYRMSPLVPVIIDQVDKDSNVELCLELLIHLEDPRALRAFYKEINAIDRKRVAFAIKGIGAVGNMLNGLTLIKYFDHSDEEIQACALAGIVRLWKRYSLYYPKKYFITTQSLKVKKAILDAFSHSFVFLPARQVIEFLVEQYLAEENPDAMALIFNGLVSFPRESRALVLRKYSKKIKGKAGLKFINLLQVTPHPILKPILLKWAFDVTAPVSAISAMQILADHDDPEIAEQLKHVSRDHKHPLSLMAFKALLAHPHVNRPASVEEFLSGDVAISDERHRIILHALKSFPANCSISSTLLAYLQQHLTGHDDELKLLCIESMRYVADEKIVHQIDGMLTTEKNNILIQEIERTLSYAINKSPSLARSILNCWEREKFVKSFSHGLSHDLVRHIIGLASLTGHKLRPFFLHHQMEISLKVQELLKQPFRPILLHGVLSCVQQRLVSMNHVLLDYLQHLDFSEIPYATALIILEQMALSDNPNLKRRALREYWTMAHDPVTIKVNFKNLVAKSLVIHE
ncbi:MAG: hypothetical protein A2X86_00935 [Bdellovibrionales bacterium GWA2_49_15]|nr:MAG: hypothetical protein A2X86_00935 [Bdellovibrionales bacterium GWA2_49_15]HAZ11764.1 hypothetical protein [Bdellovibrionales bacterium]